MILGRVDRRCFGAVRFVDARTQRPVVAPLVVRSAAARFVRNQSGLFVIAAVANPALAGYDASFSAAPTAVPIGSVTVTSQVNGGASYLARAFDLALPRDSRAVDPLPDASVFTPVDVPLFPSSTAPVLPGAARVRCSVQRATGDAAPYSMIRVLAADGSLMARGMTDWRGEGLVDVTGIPTTSFNEGAGAVLATEVDTKVEATFDPSAPADPAFVPDPDRLERLRSTLSVKSVGQKLASGKEVFVSVTIA